MENNNQEEQGEQGEGAEQEEGEELLMIEYNNGDQQQQGTEMKVEEATIEDNVAKLDFLGPIIINTDGTLSRIPNWRSLTPNEQANTLRLIAKRNKQRKEVLEQELSMY